MGLNRLLGAAILVAGVVALGFSFNAADAPVERLSESFTGKYTDNTMTYFILGAIAVVGGGLLIAFGGARR
jgi:drug/metabolite transporter (DMT)-like permease